LDIQVYGTAKIVAEEIARQTGADIQEIAPVTPYDGNRDQIRIEDYDRIYISYPIWLAYHNLIQCSQA